MRVTAVTVPRSIPHRAARLRIATLGSMRKFLPWIFGIAFLFWLGAALA